MANSHRNPPTIAAVTLLFTDIEQSTRLWEEDPQRMRLALARHDEISRTAVEAHHGVVVKTTGDGVHAVFDDGLNAIAATMDLQQALADPAATHGVPLRVRCGLHVGMVERRDNDYFGSPVNRAARIMSAAHGGQVLLSQAVVDGVRDRLPPLVSLRDLGKVRLKDLSTAEHVYQVVHPSLPQEFPALRSLEVTPNNLPQQTTSFIGRARELAQLRGLLAKTRVLTLTGSGGCGKTRLCLQMAADSLERFPDGAWLVELAPLADPDLVPQTVATVLGLKEAAGEPIAVTLSNHLKDRRLLLLLDNCEHLLDACAGLADALVRECPTVQILASSREALGIGGEQVYRLPSLSLPDAKHAHTWVSVAPFEAVQLFAERALLARADFNVTDQNASTLASICCRLDGIPLAIELAAARVRSLSVEEINRKLDERFRLLTGGSRTALPRQQTLRSLVDWSYDLLRESEKRLLQRLSVFAGGWTQAAAEHICTGEGVAEKSVLDLLTSLADKSLVLAEQIEGRTRYRLLETVRQYALDRLLESGVGAAVRGRHRDYYLALAEEAQPNLIGAQEAAWLQRLEEEHGNLRASLEWSSMDAGAAAGLRLCAALQRLWTTRGHLTEGRDWCKRFLAQTGAQERTLERAHALNAEGVLADRLGDYSDARARHEESLAIGRELGDPRCIASALNNLANVVLDQGDYAAARALQEESLAIARKLGDRSSTAVSLINLGNVVWSQGDFSSARVLLEESLAIMRALDFRSGIARCLLSLGDVAEGEGDYVTAWARRQEGLANLREVGERGAAIAYALEGLAAVAAVLGNTLRAAGHWGAAQRLREEIRSPQPLSDRNCHDSRVVAAREKLGDDPAFDRAWQQGRALTLEQAIAHALEASVERP